MDSYIKLTKDVFGDYMKNPLFSNVHWKDREEVAVAFASFVVHDLNYYADTFRVTPTDRFGIDNWLKHEKKQSCCGCSDSIVHCNSKRAYFIGYNYGH